MIDGVSLFDEGRNSLVSSSMFNQIKTLLALERTKTSEISEIGIKKEEEKKEKQKDEKSDKDNKSDKPEVKGNGFLIGHNS